MLLPVLWRSRIRTRPGTYGFFKNANIGDVIFVARGLKTCIGIGIIRGNYYYEEVPDGYCHRRKVEWITNKTYSLRSGDLEGYKNLFRIDTFSPTKVYDFLLEKYVDQYPDLKKVFRNQSLIKSDSYLQQLERGKKQSRGRPYGV